MMVITAWSTTLMLLLLMVMGPHLILPVLVMTTAMRVMISVPTTSPLIPRRSPVQLLLLLTLIVVMMPGLLSRLMSLVLSPTTSSMVRVLGIVIIIATPLVHAIVVGSHASPLLLHGPTIGHTVPVSRAALLVGRRNRDCDVIIVL